MFDLLSEYVRDRMKMPNNWHAWKVRTEPMGGPKCMSIVVTGACCPPILRGKRKGEPNYRKADLQTKFTISLTPREYDDICKKRMEKANA